MTHPKVLIINGSPRPNGNSEYLSEEIQRLFLKRNRIAEIISLRRLRFQSCIGCEKCRIDKTCTGLNDDMNAVYPLIEQAETVVAISPVHHYNVSALMKAFMDRLYCYYDFSDKRPGDYSSRLAGRGKKVITIAISEQISDNDFGFVLEAMNKTFGGLGYEVSAFYPLRGYFDRNALREDPETISGILKDMEKRMKVYN